MTEQVTADVVLDLKGLLCPMPVVKIAQAIKGVALGAVVEATASDPGVLADIPAWARSSGNELLDIRRVGKVVVFRVRRGK